MTSQQRPLGNERRASAPLEATQPSTRHGWRAVSIVLVGAFMALLDTTIVTVALPTIRAGLHASSATLLWVVSAYALAYGLALVPAGRAGDRFGHKPLFLIGLAVFTLASVACGLSQNQGEIVAARAVRASEPGFSTRPSPRPSSCRSPGPRGRRRSAPSAPRSACPSRSGRTWRPDHRGRWRPRRLALGVPGEPAHRRGRAAHGRLAAALRAIAHPPRVRPGRAAPAVRGAAPAADPAGGRRADGLACLVLRVPGRQRGRVRAARAVGGARRAARR